ncbi:voltage-dependent anion channel [Dactylonectria estremocensis]|uniref:Voltage-dependent anion channel n=1 Tax=Dactylonectria estremocensis TaxID=1079267 RepID=A0A9P9F337_9HYPO|nr:voltage-dependent anion channel [Dactylonectria estremocensis]
MMLAPSSHTNLFGLSLPLVHVQNHLKHDDWEAGHTRAADQRLKSADALSRVLLYERIRHFTWAWFTLIMSTGGIALLLHGAPHRFPGLDIIGKIFFLLTVVLFIGLVAGIAYRFYSTPPALKASLMHPTESLFFPCFLLSVATILANTAAYGVPATGPWLAVALRVCFWIYAAVSVISAIVQFFALFNGARLPIHSMTPGWILPIFPAMLTGTLASAIMPSQPPEQRLPILVAGVTYQGLGWIVASLIYPLYLGRLMQDGLPAPAMRPGMFIAVGPAGYTTLALIGMARSIPSDYGYFAAYPAAEQVLRILALWVGLWIWCVGFWFFGFSLIAVLTAVPKWNLRFSMAWWAFVFPNVGFTLATGSIGQELDSDGIKWVASAMSICIFILWFMVLYAQVLAVRRKKILWPGRDEDRP